MVHGAQLPVSHEHFGFEGLLAKPWRSQPRIAEDPALPVPGACEVDLDRVAEHLLYGSPKYTDASSLLRL